MARLFYRLIRICTAVLRLIIAVFVWAHKFILRFMSAPKRK
jgi:hypothetical protein